MYILGTNVDILGANMDI